MGTPVENGMRGFCPRCGQGRLFKSYLGFADECAACGLDYRIEDAGDGPAFFVLTLACFIIVPLMLVFHFKTQSPLWLTLLIWMPLLVVFCLGLLRPLRGAMFAQQWKQQALEATSRDLEP